MVPGLPCSPEKRTAEFMQQPCRKSAGRIVDIREVSEGSFPRIAGMRPNDRRDGECTDTVGAAIEGLQRMSPCIDGSLHEQRHRPPQFAAGDRRFRERLGERLGLRSHLDGLRPRRPLQHSRILGDCIECERACLGSGRDCPHPDGVGVGMPRAPFLYQADHTTCRPMMTGSHEPRVNGGEPWRG